MQREIKYTTKSGEDFSLSLTENFKLLRICIEEEEEVLLTKVELSELLSELDMIYNQMEHETLEVKA